MTEPAQVAKSVTHVPGRKCNPCIGTFKNRTGSEPKAARFRTISAKTRVNPCKFAQPFRKNFLFPHNPKTNFSGASRPSSHNLVRVWTAS